MLVDIDKIIVKDRIRKYFGDIDGLAESIKEIGLLNRLVVTPEMRLLAGERRLRACKQLGWKQIPVNVITVDDYYSMLRIEVDENEGREGFTFSERMDCARRLERAERLRAEERRRATQNNDTARAEVENFPHQETGKTRDIVADKVGFGSGKQYEKAKYIDDNADPDVIEKLDKGEMSIHAAWKETRDKLEQAKKELQEKDGKIDELETKLTQAEKDKAEPEVIEKEVEVEKLIYQEVVPEDIKERLKQAEERAKEAEEQMKQAGISISILEQENRELKQLEDMLKQRDSSPLKDMYVMLRSVNDRARVILHEIDRRDELVNATPAEVVSDIITQLQVLAGYKETLISVLESKSVDITINEYQAGNTKLLEGEIING